MIYKESDLKGVYLIELETFEDHRGEYVEIYNDADFREEFDVNFVQDDISRSTKNVLRGIHGDDKTWKLISCLYGKIYLVVVNCKRFSWDWGKWASFVLSDKNNSQVLVPPGFGNAHLVLSDEAIFHYKQSEFYDRDSQFTYSWDNADFGIWWPTDNPILSKRDQLKGE